ncbi:MAG TPA: multidrug efflux SMR transporter [Candidatus Dormibacteraeota bacterium]|nr:multidrug efflux SMR transporter [Candidatus Dormibacteraeota bacterium]
MSWLYLVLAGFCEIVWAIALKYSHGFARTGPSAVVLTAGFVSFYLLSLAAKDLPIGTAYAAWTGIGTVGTAILGIVLFAEPRTWLRLSCILLIVIGIAGLHMASQK